MGMSEHQLQITVFVTKLKSLIRYCYSLGTFRNYEGGDDETPSKPKVTIRDEVDGANFVAKLTTASSSVVGKVGNVVGKGLGGLTSKLGSGSWF